MKTTKTEQVFTIASFLTGAALTVWMCVGLIKEYANEPIITEMELIKNASMQLPIDPVVCISTERLYASELWYMKLYDEKIEAEFDSDCHVDADPGMIDSDSLSEKLRSYIPKFFISEAIGKKPWPKHVVKMLDKYLPLKANGHDLVWNLDAVTLAFVSQLNWTLKDSFLKARLTDELRHIKEECENATQTPLLDYVRSIFEDTQLTKKKLLAKSVGPVRNTYCKMLINRLWLRPSFVFVALHCLAMATRCEYGRACLQQRRDLNLTDKTSACIELELSLRRLNVSMDEFRQRFGSQIADIHCLTVNCGIRRTTYVSAMETCFIVDETCVKTAGIVLGEAHWFGYPLTPLLPLHSSRQFLTVSFSGRERQHYYNETALTLAWGLSLDSNDTLANFQSYRNWKKNSSITMEYFLLSSENVADNILGRSASLLAMRGTETIVEIRISAFYTYLENDGKSSEKRCSSEKTMYFCFRRCKVDLIESVLNCTPTSLISLQERKSAKQECTIQKLSSWTMNVDHYNRVEYCINNCKNPCEEWRLEVKELKNVGVLNFGAPFYIGVNYALSSYPAYRERYSMTFENFVGGLGGILGVWLGINAFLVAKIFLQFIKMLKNIYNSSKAEVSGADSQRKITAFEMVQQVVSQLDLDPIEKRFRSQENLLSKQQAELRNLRQMLIDMQLRGCARKTVHECITTT